MHTFVVSKVVDCRQWRFTLVTARAMALALAAALVMVAVLAGDVSADSSSPSDDGSPKIQSTPDATPTASLTPEPTPEPTPSEVPTPESSPEPTPEPTPEAAPEPTPEATPEATPEPTPEATPEPTSTAEPTPTATAEVESDPELPAYFPLAISQYVFSQNEDIGTQTLPEAAGGAGGFTYSLTPSLPEGLSFDATTRALTGTPVEAGAYTMAYTATDADGGDSSFEFSITVQAAPRTALQVGTPVAPTVTRTEFSEPTNPALDVSWTAPAANGLTITGYTAQYRKKAAEGQDPAAWTSFTGTVDATNRTLTLPDLDAGATYEVQVRAVTSEEGEGPWSDTGSAQANRPPTATSAAFNGGTFPVGTIANYNETGSGAVGVLFADADGDTLTYAAAAQHPALLGVSLTGAAGEAKLQITLLNQGSSKVTYTATDAYGGSVTRTMTIGITAKVSRDIAENSAAGTTVGAPVTGTPYNGVALSYTLAGKAKDSGKFVIDAATGQIKVATGATLDYETDDAHRETETWNGQVIAKFYRGEVHYTVDGHDAVINVLITVTDVEAGQPNAPTVTRTEFSEPTDPALDVSWTAPAANGLTITGYEAQYRKKAAQGADPAAWTSFTGTVNATNRTLTLPDLDAGATYEVQVRAVTSEEGASPWSNTGSGRANRPPRSTEPANLQPSYTLLWGGDDSVRTLNDKFADDDGDSLTYSVSAQYPGVLKVGIEGANSDKLRIHVLNPATSKVSYGVSDDYGGFASKDIDVSGSADAFNGADLRRSVAENSAAGTAVGDPVTGTPYDDGDDETDDALSYSLTGEAATSGAFVIDGATGQISVKQGASLDFETKSSYTGQVNWTVQGQAAAADVTISVTDLEAGQPAAPTVTRTTFSEPTNPALDVSWTAPTAAGVTISGYNVQYRQKVAQGETPNAWTAYTVTDANNVATSTLPATTTSINLADLAAGATYEAQVRAVTSEEGEGPWSSTGSGRANRPPRSTEAPNIQPSYTLLWGGDDSVRTLNDKFADDDGDSLTYSASAQYPGVLRVGIEGDDSDKLRIHVLNPATSTVTYGVFDGYGGYASKTIDVSGSADAFNGADLSRSVAENSAAGTAVGDPVTGTPYDDGDDQTDDALSYTLTGEAATSNAFTIDAATGQISVKQGATIDYEAKTSYTGRVTWTAQEQEAYADVTIEVSDLEAGKPGTPTVTRTRFEEESNPALDVSWTAPDASGATITGYEVQYRVQVADGETPNAWTTYTYTDDEDNTTSVLPATSTSVTLSDLRIGVTYQVQVRALTQNEGPGPWSDTGSGRTNIPPNRTLLVLSRQTHPMNTVATAYLNRYFRDVDGDTLTWVASSEYPGLVGVELTQSSSYLLIRHVNPGTSTLTYGAHDGYGGYISNTVNITTGQGNATRSVAENSAAGTAVGDPVGGNSYTGQTEKFSYTLTGEAATSNAFVIDSATGQISVKQGASLDYETKSSYTGKVGYTVNSQAAVINVTINVTDVEAGKPDAPTVTRTKFSEQTNPALDVSWALPTDNGDLVTWFQVQYRKKAAEGEDPAEWTAYDGPVLQRKDTSLRLSDLEAGATYEVQVRGQTDVEGAGPWSDIGAGTANRPPEIALHGGWWYFIRDEVGSRPVGESYVSHPVALYYTDRDGDTLHWDVSHQHPGIAVMGEFLSSSDYKGIEFVFSDEAQLEEPTPRFTYRFLNPATSKLTYGVHDGYGGFVHRTASPTGSQTEARAIAENSAAGTVVGDPITGTPYDDGDDETDDSLTYTLTGEAATSGAFVIDSATGQISVKQGATLDYETKNSYTGQVNWTVQGQAAAADVTITVTDLEAGQPAAPTVTRTAFSEPTNPALDVNWTAPAAVTGVTISGYEVQYRQQVAEGEEANSWTTHAYTDDEENVTSVLAASTLRVTLSDLDAGATYEVQVRARTSLEGEGPWSTTGEGQANTPPHQIPATLGWLVEGPVGTRSWIDVPDDDPSAEKVFGDADGDTLMLWGTAQHPALLDVAVSGEPGDSRLTTTILNPGTSSFTFGVHDGFGGYLTLTRTIRGYHKTGRRVAENSPGGTLVGGPVTGTPYNGETLTYTLKGKAADSGKFVIDSASGQISLRQGATLDYETDDPNREIEYWQGKVHSKFYRGEVHYTVDGHAAFIAVLLSVDDVAPPGKPGTPTATRTEFSEPTNPALDVTWTAPADGIDAVSGYGAQYRKQGATEWTAYSGTLDATTRSLNLPDLDAGAIYEVQVRAVGENEGEGPWSDIGSGQANTPPTGNGWISNDLTIPWWRTGRTAPIPNFFEDADGDTLSPWTSSAYPGLVPAWIHGNVSRFQAVNPSASPVVITYGVHDAYGGYASHAFRVSVQANDARSVRENSGGGTRVGGPVTGRRYQDETPSYSLTGEASTSGAFVIDASSGQISVASGADLDYETNNSYAAQVRWTVQGQAAVVHLTIRVRDIPPPSRPDAPTVTPAPSQPTSTLDVSWTAPADHGSAITDYDVRYRTVGASGWTSHRFSGAGRATTLKGLDSGTEYEVQVRAESSEGEGSWSDTGRGSTRTPNTPVQLDGTNGVPMVREIAENSPPGTPVGAALTASDVDGDSVVFSVSDTTTFFINAATGQIMVAGGALLDHESVSTYTLTVRVTDGKDANGNPDSAIDDSVDVTIQVLDVAEPPHRPEAPLAEPTAAEPATSLDVTWTDIALAGVPATTDYDVRYRAKGPHNWISHPFDGSVPGTVISGLEPGTIYEVQVLARNDEGESPWSESGIGITGPALLTASREVSEDAPAGAPVGAPVTSNDPHGHALSYAIVEDAVSGSSGGHNEFTIDSQTGQITVAEDANLDHQVAHRHYLTVQASHAASGQADDHITNAVISVVINVIAGDGPPDDGNRRPSFDDPPGDLGMVRQVTENAPGGTRVGAPITATDVDGDTLTYALSGASAFIIDAASGQIRVAQGAVLDYETTTSYSVTVSVTDGKNAQGQPDATVDATVDVTIEVLDQAPPAKPDAPSVAPSAAQPAVVLHVTWTAPANQGRPAITDYDLRYREVGATSWIAHAFDGAGTMTWISGLVPDTSYEVQVAASNVEGLGPWSDTGQSRTAASTVVTQPTPRPDGPTPPPEAPTPPVSPTPAPVSPTPTPVSPTATPSSPTATPSSPTAQPDTPAPTPAGPTPPPNGPDGSNGPGDAGNSASTNPPSSSSDSPSGTPVQSRAAEGIEATAAQAGFGLYSLKPSLGPSLLAGFEVWTPEKALIFSVLGPGLLGLLGLLSSLLKWKFQTSLWTALFAGLAAIFLFLRRRRKEAEDKEPAGGIGTFRPAT